MKDTEIEIQVKVEKTAQLLRFLKKNGTFIHKTYQIDEYYTPKHRNFTKVRPVKEWLRLRKTDQDASTTYKNWKYDKSGRSWHCDEHETKIERLDQLRKIFAVLNFKLLCKVDKKRTIWKYGIYEISFDRIAGLGSFVEMEYKGRKKIKVNDVIVDMMKFLKKHGCGKIQRNNGGYPFMLMFPKEVKFEKL
ncbi:class IV adenylate cyclase [Patescibacteria group bacterium]|nr:class IV adenylate cyclase [Patescibacteria group bacterium]